MSSLKSNVWYPAIAFKLRGDTMPCLAIYKMYDADEDVFCFITKFFVKGFDYNTDLILADKMRCVAVMHIDADTVAAETLRLPAPWDIPTPGEGWEQTT